MVIPYQWKSRKFHDRSSERAKMRPLCFRMPKKNDCDLKDHHRSKEEESALRRSFSRCSICVDQSRSFEQQCLNFLPLPHGQGSFRPVFASIERASSAATQRITLAGGRSAASSDAMNRI
jgi:hypothetical protein